MIKLSLQQSHYSNPFIQFYTMLQLILIVAVKKKKKHQKQNVSIQFIDFTTDCRQIDRLVMRWLNNRSKNPLWYQQLIRKDEHNFVVFILLAAVKENASSQLIWQRIKRLNQT